MGIGFVLLLGHIDLSAGVIGGVGAGVLAELLLKDMPWYLTVLIALAGRRRDGNPHRRPGLRRRHPVVRGDPRDVPGLPGRAAVDHRHRRHLPINDEVILGISNGNMPVTLGWIVVIASITAYAGINLIVYQRRRAANLVTPPLQVIVCGSRSSRCSCSAPRSCSRRTVKGGIVLDGMPCRAPIVGVLLVLWTFVQNRTAFGRHIYAVGSNAEAARRAGIRVGRITIACFVISSAMAVTAGIIAASRLNSITPDAGAGNTLLYAVAAAVIGGASLFGGKGKARDAIIGGLVIAVIDNGLGLLGLQAYIKFIVTGIVLLLAASVDALSRRRRASAGG